MEFMSNQLTERLNEFYLSRPIKVENIIRTLAEASIEAREEDFEAVLWVAKMDELYEECLSSPAMAILPAWGEKGVDQLLSFAFGYMARYI